MKCKNHHEAMGIEILHLSFLLPFLAGFELVGEKFSKKYMGKEVPWTIHPLNKNALDTCVILGAWCCRGRRAHKRIWFPLFSP